MQCNNCEKQQEYDPETYELPCTCGGHYVPELADIFEKGCHGILREQRPAQYNMAKDIKILLDLDPTANGVLLAQGGTGVGKSFAYLIPSILSGKRVVLATATKNLQQQIYDDLNKVLAPLTRLKNLHTVLYKGKNNYGCLQLADTIQNTYDRQKFKKWVGSCMSSGVPADKVNWPKKNINDKEPKWWKRIGVDLCPYEGRRKKCLHHTACKPTPKNADVLVVSHSLHAIDMFKGPTGWLFDDYDVAIVDEAHDFASNCRGQLTFDIRHNTSKKIHHPIENNPNIQKFIDDLGAKDASDTTIWHTRIQRQSIRMVKCQEDFLAALKPYENLKVAKIVPGLLDLHQVITPLVDAAKALHINITCIDQKWTEVCDEELSTVATVDKPALVDRIANFKYLAKRVKALAANTRILQRAATVEEQRTFIVFKDANLIQTMHVDIGTQIERQFKSIPYRVYTSATMNHSDKFDHFKKSVGLDTHTNNIARVYKSPFNYRKNVAMYIPAHLPEFNEYELVLNKGDNKGELIKRGKARVQEEKAQIITELSIANHGNALFLFTSNEDLNAVAALTDRALFNSEGLTLFVQDTENNNAAAIQKEFKRTPHGVIFGLKSFQQGVDFKGLLLSMVVWYKLPFPHPSSPEQEAEKKLAVLKELDKGADIDLKDLSFKVFREVSVPQMLTNILQGFGRLVRTMTDGGIFGILDSRIFYNKYRDDGFLDTEKAIQNNTPDEKGNLTWGTPYANQVIRAIPVTTRVHNIEEIIDYQQKLFDNDPDK